MWKEAGPIWSQIEAECSGTVFESDVVFRSRMWENAKGGPRKKRNQIHSFASKVQIYNTSYEYFTRCLLLVITRLGPAK